MKAMKNAYGDRLQPARECMEAVQARLKELSLARCGPDPSEAETMRQGDYEKIVGAGQSASGLGDRQYAMLTERVQPFCRVLATAKAADPATDLARKSGYVYAAGELTAMRAQYATLLPLF